MKCPNCNTVDHEPTAKFCHICGTTLVPDSNDEGTGREPPKLSKLFRIRRNGLYGFVNQNGTEVIPPQFTNAHDFSEGLAAVQADGQWGFIGQNFAQNRRWVVEPQFEEVRYFSESMAAVRNGAWGYINQNGQHVIPCQFQDTKDFSESLAAVSKDGTWGFVDKTGERIIPLQFGEAFSFKNGLARVRVKANRRFGFINQKGVFVIRPTLDYARDFNEQTTLVKRVGENYYEYINTKGRKQLICQWVCSGDFHEDLACVQIGNEYGFIDRKGNVVIDAIYDDAKSFSEGLAPVRLGNLWGYINKKHEMVIFPRFDDAGAFQNGVAMVREGDNYEAIDNHGNTEASNLCETSLCEPKETFMLSSVNQGAKVSRKTKMLPKKIVHHLLLALLAIVVTIVEFIAYDDFHGWGWALVPCIANLVYTVYRILFIEDECGGVFHNYDYAISFGVLAVINTLAFIFTNGWVFLLLIPLYVSILIDYEIHH